MRGAAVTGRVGFATAVQHGFRPRSAHRPLVRQVSGCVTFGLDMTCLGSIFDARLHGYSRLRSTSLLQVLMRRFTLDLPDSWTDQTLHTLVGPVVDDHQHAVLIASGEIDGDPPLAELAAQQIAGFERSMPGAQVLASGPLDMLDGTPAHRVIFSMPNEAAERLYAEQIYVRANATLYMLTATFTRLSRQTIGERVERVMRSFSAEAAPEARPPADRHSGQTPRYAGRRR